MSASIDFSEIREMTIAFSGLSHMDNEYTLHLQHLQTLLHWAPQVLMAMDATQRDYLNISITLI